MQKNDFHVIVVGAGPAGCAAAYHLREHGISVLLIDKSEFPRVKPCAGGLTIKTLRALPYTVEPVIRRICHNVVIGNKTGKSTLFKSKQPVCAMTVRAEFDHFCLGKTLEKGAVFQIHQKISGIEIQAERIILSTENGRFSADYLIGADGANSVVRKLSGVFPAFQRGMAIEGRVPLPPAWAPEMEFDIGVVDKGYGWLFPKHDHVNVGLYTNNPDAGLRKKDLLDYCRKKLHTEQLDHMIGHYVGLGGHKYVPDSSRIFLVGDAAGLVDPLLGEGIYNAIKSGQYAGKAIAEEIKGGETAGIAYRRMMETLQKDLGSSRDFSLWLYQNVSLAYFALVFPLMKAFIMKSFASGMTFFELKQRFLKGRIW